MLPNLRLGGAERVVVNLLKYIDRSQFQVELLIIDGRDSELLDEVPSDVKIVDLRCRRLRYALPFLLMRVVRVPARCAVPQHELCEFGLCNVEMGDTTVDQIGGA